MKPTTFLAEFKRILIFTSWPRSIIVIFPASGQRYFFSAGKNLFP